MEKQNFYNGQRVELCLNGHKRLCVVCGKSFEHIFDIYIVKPDERLPDQDFDCITVPESFLKALA